MEKPESSTSYVIAAVEEIAIEEDISVKELFEHYNSIAPPNKKVRYNTYRNLKKNPDTKMTEQAFSSMMFLIEIKTVSKAITKLALNYTKETYPTFVGNGP